MRRQPLTPHERDVYDRIRTEDGIATLHGEIAGFVARRLVRHRKAAEHARIDRIVNIGHATTLASLHKKGRLSIVAKDATEPIYMCILP
jgi:hypothetical protein